AGERLRRDGDRPRPLPRGMDAPSESALSLVSSRPPVIRSILGMTEGRLALFLGVAGAQSAKRAQVFGAAVAFGLRLPFRLALHAQAGERHGLQPLCGDLALAAFANAVRSLVDALERLIDGLDLRAISIREEVVDFAIAFFARDVVSVAAIVLLPFAVLLEIVANAAQDLRLHVEEGFLGLLEKCFADAQRS